MSNRQATTTDVKFEPVPDRGPSRPGEALLIFGVIYPVGVIAFELLTQMCANAMFDPMPTAWHAAVVALVPASNLLLWLALQKRAPRHGSLLAFANGAAMSIAAFYALLFLPLLPVAIVGVVFIFGLLPFAPLATFVSALKLRKALRERQTNNTLVKPLLAGLAAGLALLLALDVRAAATRHGIQLASSSVPAERTRGLALLHTLGDNDLLLRLCYGIAGQSTGLLSAFVIYSNNNIFDMRRRSSPAVSPEVAREVYYRLHGTPFNARPAPFESGKWSNLADFQFDDDHGGAQVGGRLKGLSLVGSRLDGSISGDDDVAYLEWTVEFRNTGFLDREARVQFALPPRGVVSRATLWVNGEEREAAYAGRGAARAAYQRVAVQQRRDPLLVTTKGADRVLAQAFPVPRNGTLKFKLGITAPLELVDAGLARLTLPAIVDRNFSFEPELSHSVWIESKGPLAASAPGLASSHPDAKLFRLTGSLTDRDLAGTRPAITVDRDPNVVRVAARWRDSEPVVQELTRNAQTAGAVMLVIDGSARLAGSSSKLIKALSTLPSSLKVGVMVAADPVQSLPLAPWSDAQKQRIATLLRATSFAGGQDNAPGLAEALSVLEAEPNATLLWIHGPQPISFRASAGRLEQAAARLSHLPEVVLYAVEPGPNEVLPDAPLAWGAHALPQTGSLEADLSAFFARLSGQTPSFTVTRSEGQPAEGLPKGSDHIARLWANDRILELMRANPSSNRGAATELAATYHLITPVSGAVVLENQQQFDEAALTPATQATLPTVPTVPEPHEWALILIASAALIWLVWRGRQRFAVAA